VPAALDAVVARCLEKRREERYPSVEAVLEDLRRAVREGGAKPVPAVGLYAEARLEGAADAQALGPLDALLERVSEALRAAGLTVVIEGAGCLFAAAPLPETEADARQARHKVLKTALELLSPLPLGEGQGEGARPRAPTSVTLALTVHVDLTLPRRDTSGPPRLSGDGLLQLSEWTGAHPGQGLVATSAALRDLEAHFHVEPLAEAPGLWRVRGPL
jgi:serine/threonine-protein kinase